MKAALVVCLLAATALGAPKPAEVQAADAAWNAAANEPDPAKRPARWEAAIGAIDRYIAVAGPNAPDLPRLLFSKGRAYAESGHLDLALPIYRTIVTRFPRSTIAEYAANLALDGYNRLRDYETMIAFANELANDPDFLRDRGDLATTVKRIQAQAAYRRAEELERIAHESKDPERYTSVAEAYLAIYNANPKSPTGDELLYNAGVSFEEARAISSATRMFDLLRKQYPHSKLAARATARLAMLYADTAIYDRAADLLEEYAKKYAGEKDAYAALSDAVYYRKATGNRAKAIEDTRYFIKTFGSKKPRESADAMWSLTALYDGDDAIKHLREYLRTFGAKGGSGRVVIAYSKIAQLLLKQSCSIRGVDGLCVTVKERARTCGKGTTRTLAATARNAKKVADARAALEQAIREYERNAITDDVEARYAYAQARVAQADLDLEAYLGIAIPRGLDFDDKHRADSTKRFSTWLDQMQKSGATLTRRYEAVLATKDVASSITAAERIAIVSQSFATAMATAEMPRDIAKEPMAADKKKAFCAAMNDVIVPLEERAALGFGVCLAKSTELAWFGDSSAFCESQLARMKPEEFPLAHELRSVPADYAPVIATEPPLR
jgi:TolA-binding protein